MADIMKCKGSIGAIDCPYKEKCYRFTAKASDYQSYFMELPLKDDKCDMYWGARVHQEHLEGSNYKIKNK